MYFDFKSLRLSGTKHVYILAVSQKSVVFLWFNLIALPSKWASHCHSLFSYSQENSEGLGLGLWYHICMQMVAVQKTFLRHTQMPILFVEWITQTHRMSAANFGFYKEFRVGGFCVLSHIIDIIKNCQIPQAGGQTPHCVQLVVVLSQVYQYCFFQSWEGYQKIEDGSKTQTQEGIRSNSRDVIQ